MFERTMTIRAIATVGVAAALLITGGCAARPPRPAQPADGSHTFIATAYCRGQVTASGGAVRAGIVAADPAVLPLGTVIRIDGLGRRYSRVYRVMDTGGDIRGRRIDVYIRDCNEAIRFGRKPAVVSVIRSAPASRR
jgi:3D (Asp-Asp-Asp) domain-containing protein